MRLTAEQKNLLELPIQSKIFLQGMAGSGKSTTGTLWLKKLLTAGVPAQEIIIFVPQRALAEPYEMKLHEVGEIATSLINTLTLGGLARRMIDLFWPLVCHEIGVSHPDQPPQFLTMETAQYYMAHLVRPLIEEQGFFNSLTINRNRIYSQILDNLNKAAIMGFPYEQVGERLKSAWVGEIEQYHIFDDLQICLNQFRSYCLENNLLDFSLQVEIFHQHLWHSPICRAYLKKSFHHLIADNIEEDTPVSHDILREWLPDFNSTLFIFDENAGFRYFLGADVQSALALRKLCDERIKFEQNLINSPGIIQFKNGVHNAIAHLQGEPEIAHKPIFKSITSALSIPQTKPKYFPQMIRWVADQVNMLIQEGTPPGEIVILAPFMPDVLRFSLANQLDELDIPHISYRPSRSLREEPATQTLLTLATLTFPSWGLLPERINLAFALMQVVEGLDLVRAQLLTAYTYNQNTQGFPLQPFDIVPADIRDRITYRVGQRYDYLRNWLESAHQMDPQSLDFLLNRLFGEVLSQPGYKFHRDLNSGNTIAMLIESIQKFRWAIGAQRADENFHLGKEYVQMVQDGVIAAQYAMPRDQQDQNAVLLSPAYTFLLRNQAVDVQFWLDIGSPSWYQRLDQPLTHPYVLSRHWEKGDIWTAENELIAAYQTLQRISIGLLNRCKKMIFIGMSELDIRGFENRGLLIRIINHILRTSQQEVK